MQYCITQVALIGALLCALVLTTAGAQEVPTEVKMLRGPELGWKDHPIRVGDGEGGWKYQGGEYQFLHADTGGAPAEFGAVKAFGITQMDNGEIMILASWDDKDKAEVPMTAFSKDRGATWSDWQLIPGASGRPMMLAYLGKGNLTFSSGKRYFSKDYGRTWPESIPVQPPSNDRWWSGEGNPLVDRDASGNAVRMAEIGFNYAEGAWPNEPCDAFFRWSDDGGRTWVDEVKPEAWRIQIEYEGTVYTRSVCEGSVVRAKNGWLVAALRTDVHPRWIPVNNDNLCGEAVSISKDEGKTWSPMRQIWEAGRNHAHLLRLENGDLVMTYVMRQDVGPDGEHYASYRRGCGALVSKDNGQTWDVSSAYALDEFEYVTAAEGITSLACGHIYSCLLDNGQILTAYSHYPTGAIGLIRWQP